MALAAVAFRLERLAARVMAKSAGSLTGLSRFVHTGLIVEWRFRILWPETVVTDLAVAAGSL